MNLDYKYNSEISKMPDDEEKLRYILGGLIHHCVRYWSCDIKCSTKPVPKDENLIKVINFIKRHNLDCTSFLELAYSYFRDGFYKYNGYYGPFIDELVNSIERYNIKPLKENKMEVVLRDDEILLLLNEKSNNKELYEFLRKYDLSDFDFLVLAKTKLNYGFYICHGFEKSLFYEELTQIIKNNISYIEYDEVMGLRKNSEKQINLKEEKNSKIKKL